MLRYSTEKTEEIDWGEAIIVFEKAPLGKREPLKLKNAFEASYAVVYVFDSDKLIGLARALCDGEYQAAIYDVVLLPDYQKQGIGKRMMELLRKQLPVKNVILYAVPGREGFYSKCGFKKMLTAMADLPPASVSAGYLEDISQGEA